jgi:cobalt-zinc-cadmium efflux system outer membrane protein
MSGSRGLCAFALGLALGVPARAQAESDAAPPAAHLSAQVLLHDERQLIVWLNQHSPELLGARARVVQSSADLASSRLLPNPVVDTTLANLPLGSTNPPGLSFDQVAIFSVGLSETVELGKRGPRADAAALREQSTRLQAEGTLGERLATARSSLGLAVHLGARLVILDESLKAAENGAELERTRFEQKALSGMDYDRLLLDLASLKSEYVRNQADYVAALETCRAVLAGDCDVSGANEDDLAAAVPITVPTATEPRLLERPDVKALDLDRQASVRDADLARARAIPDLTVRLGYTHDRFTVSGDNRNTLEVGVQLPLPVFDHGQHDASKALGHADEVAAARTALLAASRAELNSLIHRKTALEKNLELLESDSLPRSRSVLDSAQHAFDIGGTSLTDLLLVRRSHIALELTRLDQRFELFSVRNELYRLLALETDTKEK